MVASLVVTKQVPACQLRASHYACTRNFLGPWPCMPLQSSNGMQGYYMTLSSVSNAPPPLVRHPHHTRTPLSTDIPYECACGQHVELVIHDEAVGAAGQRQHQALVEATCQGVQEGARAGKQAGVTLTITSQGTDNIPHTGRNCQQTIPHTVCGMWYVVCDIPQNLPSLLVRCCMSAVVCAHSCRLSKRAQMRHWHHPKLLPAPPPSPSYL